MKKLLLPLMMIFLLSCSKKEEPGHEPLKEDIKYTNILILGNSITYHAADASLGWNNNNGMAASKPELDYVHLLTTRLQAIKPSLQLNTGSFAKFESNYPTFNLAEELKAYEALKPDLVILRIGENIHEHTMNDAIFKEKYGQLIDQLKSISPGTDILSVASFWQKDRTDNIMKDVTTEKNGYYISLGDIGNDATNTAWGLFANPGEGSHPGDKGMKAIAGRIYDQIVKQSR